MGPGFVEKYDRVYVIEQNRDGQVHSLLRSSLVGGLDARLISLTHYNGTPIAADDITHPILDWERTYSEHGPLTGDRNGAAEAAPAGPVVSTE